MIFMRRYFVTRKEAIAFMHRIKPGAYKNGPWPTRRRKRYNYYVLIKDTEHQRFINNTVRRYKPANA